MTDRVGLPLVDGEEERIRSLYRWHTRAAVVRSLGSFIMWLTCLGAYGIGLIHLQNLVVDSIAVAYLILMNPPLLWLMKRSRRRRTAERLALIINALEVIGYTAVIYALGGIEATYLLPIYAALITYVGARGPGFRPFLVAGMCILAFGAMLTLEHLGWLPSLRINPDNYFSWPQQLAILSVTAALLMIVAFVSSYTAGMIYRGQEELARQNEALQIALARAREADRLKAEFLANVTHELRTPLNAIIGFSELLKEGYLGDLSEGQREALRDVHTSGSHLLAIINDLLDLSRVEAGQMNLNPVETDLKTLLEEIVEGFCVPSREKELVLAAELEECPPILWADRQRLRQIVDNLLANALKFTPPGGEVCLSVRKLIRDGVDWRSTSGEFVYLPFGGEGVPGERVVEIRVADTGIGLKTQDLERIFKPFVQADGSIARRYEGSGLGLSLTRRFVELHGGKVWAESGGENQGTLFRVLLPL